MQETLVRPTDLKPSTADLILGDPWCKGLVVFVVIIWGYWLWTGPLGGTIEDAGPGKVSGKFAIIVSLLLLAWLYKRVQAVGSFFDRAQEIEGTVEEVSSDGKRAAVHYQYVVRGRKHHGKYELWHRQSMFFSEGQSVWVLFDRSKPERSYLKQQFTGLTR